jgi:hypothetical protein
MWRTLVSSFDHLVGASEERGRHGQAQRLGGLEIDYQLELGWLLDGQVRGLSPFDDLVNVASRPS